MNVLVDTAVWSLALRQRVPDPRPALVLQELMRGGRIALLGMVRQETLSGIRERPRYLRVRDQLRAFKDHRIRTAHHEEAAEMYTRLQAVGVQSSFTDVLLCAASVLDQLPIYSTDKDFVRYSEHLPILLFHPWPA